MSGQGGQGRQGGLGGLRRIKGWATASAVIAGAVAVAFGTGFTVSRAVLADGGAWLSSGTSVAHVNAGTGHNDATIDEPLVGEIGDQEVVTSPSGTAVIDTGRDTVTTLDTTTMTTAASAPLPEGEGRHRFVVAGRFGYLIGATRVQPVDPVTLRHRRRAIEVGHVGGAVATAEGTLVVLDANAGTAIELVEGQAELPVEVAPRPSSETLALTAVSGRPVVVDSAAGTVLRLRPGGTPEDPVRVRGLAGVPLADVAVADPSADGATVWLVRRSTGRLLGADLDTGQVRSGRLDRSGSSLQEPVVLAGRVYVPHGDSHSVTVVDGTSGELHQIARHEPEGTGPRLEVFAHGGRVWINDPAAQHALVVEPDGRQKRVVDKGTGEGADDPDGGPSGPGTAGSGATSPQPASGGPPVGGLPSPGIPTSPGPAGPGPGPVPGRGPGPSTTTPPAETDVPRVVGLDRDEACDRVQAAQLVCDDRPVPEAPAGTDQDEVVHQEPAGGRAPVFSAVVVEYYAPDPIPVPDLDDLRVASGGDAANGPACQTVVQAGFTCQPRVVAAADGQPADEVLPSTQQPRRGADELPGEDVAFDYAPSTLVPPLTGMTATEACAAVTALNLYCAVDHVTVGATPGQVTSQTPAPGTEVPADSPVARSQVTVQVPQRISQVPEVRGQDQATACGLLAAESLQCSWEANPVNSIRNPNVADAQSIAAGTPVAPGTVVSVFHPAGPDVNLQQFRAYTADGRPLERWAMAPDAGPGRNVYDMFLTPPRNRLWRPEGSVGRCYSTQVEGSSPLSAFMRRSPDDPDHERHFYSDGGPGDEQYERGVDYYGAPTGVLCYVIPWNAAPGATHVSEWWKDQDHYYTPGGGAPGAGFTQVFGHWMTW